MVQQKDQRKKGYNTFRFDPYPNQRVGLKKETNTNTTLTSKRKSNVNPNGQCSLSLSTVGRLVSTSTLGKGINRKRLSCDNLNEINRINSLSVNNLNSLNSTTSVSTITLTTIPSTSNELTNKRGLSSLEPCCLCCTPRTKLTKNNSTTNLRHQSRNNRASNKKLDDSRKNLNSLKDEDEESNQLERYVPSQELYKKLVKEHLQLQSSFKILCQRLEEEKERSVTESNEKQSLKEEINNMMRKVDLLAMELQEARDQNELMEFRILESEQSKATFSDETTNLIKCDKAIQLEPLKEVDEEEVGKQGNLILPPTGSPEKRKTDHSNELFLYGLTGKRSAVSFGCLPGGKTHKSCSSLESYGLTLSLTSEDEGLGDDGRRDQFSGPSSLSDMQMSDEESTGSTGSSSKSTDVAIQTSSSSSSSSQIDSPSVSIATDSTAVVGTLITGPCRYCKESTKLEDKVNLLMEQRDNLQEQVLELEEAENDARLVSQRLQRQVENLVNQVDCLQISLGKANQQIDQCNETIHTLREGELKLKVDFMMALIAKSEDSPSKLLDELKAKLKEKKNELASMGPMVFSSLNTFDDRSFDSPSSTTFNGSSSSSANRHNFKQAIYNQQQQQQHGNSFNQQYQPYLQLTSFNGGPDDCEIFVPEDSLPPDPGSSFHVQMLTSSRYNNCRPSQPTTSTFSTSRSSPLPLCETVKPKKIDLLLSSSSPTYSSSSSPPLSTSSSPLVSPASSSSSSSSSNLSPPSPLSPSSPPLLSTVMLPSNPVNQIN